MSSANPEDIIAAWLKDETAFPSSECLDAMHDAVEALRAARHDELYAERCCCSDCMAARYADFESEQERLDRLVTYSWRANVPVGQTGALAHDDTVLRAVERQRAREARAAADTEPPPEGL